MVLQVALERSRLQLPVLKITATGQAVAVFGEIGPLWYGVHWAGGRQLLCAATDEESCPLCGFAASRVIGVTLALVEVKPASRAFLLEVSPLSWSNLEQRCHFEGLALKEGVRCEITRPRSKGMLRIQPVSAGSLAAMWLDADRRLLGAWAILYGLPLPTLTESFPQFLERVLSVVRVRCQAAADAMRK